MLTDEEKDRILQEELLRNEIRKSLERDKGSKILKFLNSPFGLWVLSTVFIGLVSFGYKSYSEHLKEIEERRKILNGLAFEIGQRFQPLDLMNNSSHISSFINSMDSVGRFSQAGDKYGGRTTESIIWEFSSMTGNELFLKVYKKIKFMVASDSLDQKTINQLQIIGLYLNDYGIYYYNNLKAPESYVITNGTDIVPISKDSLMNIKL